MPKLSYDDLGAGEHTILCLPGWCIRRTLFSDLAERVRNHARVLAIDWRGHGDSVVDGDFGENELIEDALAVIERSGARLVVPVAQAQAGWIAIELSRRLGDRVAGLIFTSWTMSEQPASLRNALGALQDPERWQSARDQLIALWLSGASEELTTRIRSVVGNHGFEMWSRAGRAIAGAYDRESNPIAALSKGARPPRVLHLYAQPRAPEYLAAQEELARANPWFRVERLDGTTHFPMIECPDLFAARVLEFLDGSASI